MLAEVTPWVNAFMNFSYEDATSDNTLGASGSKRRNSNSRIYLDKGFITFGNFTESGLYGSIGQLYVPFGRAASGMISYPLVYYIGQTKARAITLNYIVQPGKYPVIPYLHTFVFKGDSNYGSHTDAVKNFGADTGFFAGNNRTNTEIGVGYVENIADANGMQDNGTSSGFRGFEKTSDASSETLVHQVQGIDVHGDAMYGPFSFLAEYVSALTQFSARDMTFDGHGAKPSAANVEAAYTFKLFEKSSSISLGYGQTNQALALNIPQHRWIATWAYSYFPSTTFSLEYKRDTNYDKGDTASGGHSTAFAVDTNTLGKRDNTVTAQVGVYF
jgi:hypothetical protein